MIRKRIIRWISIAVIVFSAVTLVRIPKGFGLFGEEIPFLIQLIAHAITQIRELQTIVGSAEQTVGLLEEMNRGVKNVLILADTAHLPLPPQVYENAKRIDEATRTATSIYGGLSGHAPGYTRTQFQSGVEGLFLSADAFQYSSFLDDKGRQVKDAAIVSSQATATRLSAETLGVLLHAVSHENRIQAKQLEIASTRRIEDAAKEDSKLQSFTETQDAIERNLKTSGFTPLNAFGKGP